MNNSCECRHTALVTTIYYETYMIGRGTLTNMIKTQNPVKCNCVGKCLVMGIVVVLWNNERDYWCGEDCQFYVLKNQLPVLLSWFWYLLFGIFSQTVVRRS